MKLLLATDRQQEQVEGMVKDPDPLVRPEIVVRWGPMNLVGRWKEGFVTHQNNGLIVLDATLLGNLPRLYPRERVEVDVMMDSVPVRLFTGDALRPRRESGNVKLLASSPGHWLERTPFNERTSYNGVPATDVIFDCALRCPYHQALVSVDPASTPKVNLEYDHNVFVLNGVNEAEKQATYTHQDTPQGGFRSFKLPDPLYPGAVDWSYDVQLHCLRGKWSCEPLESEEYSKIVVYKTGTDNRYAFPPIEVDVDHFGRTPPPGAVRHRVEISDEDLNRAPNAAEQLAYDLAARHGRGLWKATMTVPFNPFLLRYGVVAVTETDSYDDVTVKREWLFQIEESVRHVLARGMETELSMIGVLVSETEILPELVPGERRNPAVRPIPVVRSSGRVYVRADAGPWVVREGKHVYFLPHLSGGIVTHDVVNGRRRVLLRER